jgi:uncharacterized membrane protein YraQ (UPF0718 family)
MTLMSNFLELFMESAPWLILGFAVAGVMKVLVPKTLLARHLGKSGIGGVVKAALLGAPLPLCSCGVIPAALGLRRAGASKSATTSFLISTPETGVDSIAISYALLGPFMAIIRPIAAITTAITAGLMAGSDETPPKDHATHVCCAKDDVESAQEVPASFLNRVQSGLKFTFIDLVHDITLWLLIGLSMAAVIQTVVPREFLTQWGDGLMAFVIMAAIGVPMYICATASTPIAAGLLFSGVSPGAVLVFMLVGPATNIATVGLVKSELGNRALAAYLGAVIGVGFLFGYLTNVLAERWDINFQLQTEQAHELVNQPLAIAASLLLASLMLYSLFRRLIKFKPSPEIS